MTTSFRTNFTAYSGAVLHVSWLGEFLDGEVPAPNNRVTHVYNDTVGFRLNGNEFVLADAITTTLGVGLDNTRWQELVYALPTGNITLEFWARNAGDAFNAPRLAIDNIRVAYATAPVPEPETWVMIVAGLGLVSLTAFRRQKQQLVSIS